VFIRHTHSMSSIQPPLSLENRDSGSTNGGDEAIPGTFETAVLLLPAEKGTRLIRRRWNGEETEVPCIAGRTFLIRPLAAISRRSFSHFSR
jgi:hypothetical protein